MKVEWDGQAGLIADGEGKGGCKWRSLPPLWNTSSLKFCIQTNLFTACYSQ